MSFADRKFEMMIGALVIVLLCGMAHLFRSVRSSGVLESDIVYEMPRPKNFQGSDLDLSDREISRNYLNPFDKKNAKKDLKDDGKTTTVGATKAAADAAAKKAAAAAAAAKKAQVTARVIERTNSPGLSGQDLPPSANNYPVNVGGYRMMAGNNATATGNTNEDDNKRSPDQWKALLLGEPTLANMKLLIDARNKGEVDSGTYNVIIANLLKNNQSSIQDVGLYGAVTFPDAESFTLVVQSKSHLSNASQTKAEEFLLSFKSSSRVGSLAGALESTDAAVVVKATEVILAGYEEAKKNISNTAQNPRTGRGDLTVASLTSYQNFIPLLQKLAQSDDPTVKQSATQALAQIKIA